MKYMFIIGGSGTGKTTLANILGEYRSNEFHVVKGSTTRQPRPGETEDNYNFLTDDIYDNILNGERFIGESTYLMSPIKYGYEKSLLNPEKRNILILSIEGLINAMKKIHKSDDAIVINIVFDDKPFVDRDGRDAGAEQRFNVAVLRSLIKTLEDGKEYLSFNNNLIKYREFSASTLSEYYDSIKNIREHKLPE